MRVLQTKFAANPFTELIIQLVIHPTDRCLMAFYHRELGPSTALWAFCAHSPSVGEDGVSAQLNFCRRTICMPLIAHEVTHAVDAVLAHQHLLGNGEYVAEIRAETAEQITRETLKFCKAKKIKVALW